MKKNRDILTEEKNSKLKDLLFDMVRNGDLLRAIKITNGLDVLKIILKGKEIKDKYKIDAIKKIASKYDGIHLSDPGLEPIHYETYQTEYKEVGFLGSNRAVVDVWDTQTNDYIYEFSIEYENLPTKTIDKILEMLLDHPDIKSH
jgi:hypothetical protein